MRRLLPLTTILILLILSPASIYAVDTKLECLRKVKLKYRQKVAACKKSGDIFRRNKCVQRARLKVRFAMSKCRKRPMKTVELTRPRSFRITHTVTVANRNFELSRLSVILPLPRSNVYQQIKNVRPGTGGRMLTVPGKTEKYLQFFVSNGTPRRGESASFRLSYDVVLYDIKANLQMVPANKSYNRKTKEFQRYKGSNPPFIDVNHSRIKSIGDNLWRRSAGNHLQYARLAYEYVASNFSYLNAYSGMHPLAEIFRQGGGDCGNLSSIFISLMRYKGIPARHLVGVRPDGTWHAWADFFLQDFGWVPVDVTYKYSNPSGDYFGVVNRSTNGIILNTDLNLMVDRGDNQPLNMPLLQSYGWWVWGRGQIPNNITSSIRITSN